MTTSTPTPPWLQSLADIDPDAAQPSIKDLVRDEDASQALPGPREARGSDMTRQLDPEGERCVLCGVIGPFPHVCQKLATELVATFQPMGESGKVSIVISSSSMENLWDEIDSFANEDDFEGPIGVVTLERKPVGFVESLPEHEGW